MERSFQISSWNPDTCIFSRPSPIPLVRIRTNIKYGQTLKTFTFVGIALSNNPVGLAAYILEKFATWTFPQHRSSPDGGLDLRKDLFDAYFDNIMLYYLSKSITTSVRLYSETMSLRHQAHKLDRVQTNVPTGCARFKNDLAHDIDWVLKDKYTNIVQSTYYKNGGHFAALELPSILYEDFMNFVKKVEK